MVNNKELDSEAHVLLWEAEGARASLWGTKSHEAMVLPGSYPGQPWAGASQTVARAEVWLDVFPSFPCASKQGWTK